MALGVRPANVESVFLMRKIDVFTHISPPGYSEAVERIAGGLKDIGKRTRGVPMLHDLDVRFGVMEKFPQYQQVLSLPTPPIELFATPAWKSSTQVCDRHPR